MPIFAGSVWKDGREVGQRFVRIDAGRIVEEGPGWPRGARDATILDGVHNYHTHVGDAFLRGRSLPRSLAALVRPGTGYKHRMLAKTPRPKIVAGMRDALRGYHDAGTRSILDFREQGVSGLRLLQTAASKTLLAPAIHAFGRTVRTPTTDVELGDVLERGTGIGLSALSDVSAEDATRTALACRAAGKPLALHLSEQRREPIDDALALAPAFLVHLCAAEPKDWAKLAAADVPVVLCPSSNAFFRLRSPIREASRRRVPFFLGTDNAMFGHLDVVGEVARLRRWAPDVPDEEFLRALTTPPEKAIKRVQPVSAAAGVPERVVVLPRRRSRVDWGSRPLVAAR